VVERSVGQSQRRAKKHLEAGGFLQLLKRPEKQGRGYILGSGEKAAREGIWLGGIMRAK